MGQNVLIRGQWSEECTRSIFTAHTFDSQKKTRSDNLWNGKFELLHNFRNRKPLSFDLLGLPVFFGKRGKLAPMVSSLPEIMHYFYFVFPVALKAGLHVRCKRKPRVNQDDASTSARKRSACLRLCLRRPGSHVAYSCIVRVNKPLVFRCGT